MVILSIYQSYPKNININIFSYIKFNSYYPKQVSLLIVININNVFINMLFLYPSLTF